ncbi:mobile mystery protein A [Bdellovibrio sp. HCB274]|uniref:mobile mystery protein A n=1 Tax=Bdellovibrio sp. HCB274 TaxID=3394361 RepID=UPI0039B52E39
MSASSEKLRRNQLDRNFENFKSKVNTLKPKKGWIKEIRMALGMSMADLGSRMGVIKQRIEALEKSEATGNVTVESLKRAADAMDCEFVYYFVPRQGLQKFLESEARKIATKIVQENELSMKLEQQGTSNSAQANLVNEIANELIRSEGKRIWRSK